MKQTFRLRNYRILNILCSLSSLGLALFGFLVIVPPIERNVYVSAAIDGTQYDLTLTTNESIDIELTPTVDGSIAIVKDTVTGTSTSPSGYKLYLSVASEEDNNIYLNEDNTNNTVDKTFLPTTGTYTNPVSLTIDPNTEANLESGTHATWGYAVPGLNNFDSSYSESNPNTNSKFAAIPTYGNEQLIHNHEGTVTNNTTDIYYGIKANTNIANGSYSTDILYTSVTEMSSIVEGEATITPNELEEGYSPTTVQITTSLKTDRNLGTITATIGNQACTNIIQTGDNPVSLTCQVPTGLATGSYDVAVSFGGIGKTYTITNGMIINEPPIVMQSMTPELCDSLTLEQQYHFIDSRDNKLYWVAKLKDGKCWMTQNLDLNLDSTMTLTNENTDLNSVSSWTPTRSTIDVTSNMTTTGASATITGWTNDNNTPYSVDPGNVYFDGTYFSSSSCNYLTTNCIHFKNTKQTLNNEHGHVGNYYNWSVVVASNNTASFATTNADYPDSICPKGWRLPHGVGSSSGNDFESLNNAYGGITNSDRALLSAPLFFVRAGGVGSGSLSSAASYGDYWSSTVSSSDIARNLYLYSGYVDPSNIDNRDYGFSARCVARGPMYTITWNANGGTVDPATTTKESGSTIGTLPTPTYDGYEFQGWFTEATGGAQISTTTTVTADVTYYAHWEKINPFNVAFANAGKSKQNGYYKMQDMTASICSAIATPTTVTEDISTQLIDTRDNKVYWVSKLLDGNCWMTQNLDLDLSASKTLTPDNTDIASNWTPARDTVKGTNLSSSTWTNSNTSPYSFDGGNAYLPGGVLSATCTNKDITTCSGAGTLDLTDATAVTGNTNAHYHVGNLYNWSAALAMNDTSGVSTTQYTNPVDASICPKGWRLPTAYGGSSSATGEFKTLNSKYGNSTSSDANLIGTPLFFVRSGDVSSGSLYHVGSYGYYRSSTVSSSSNAYLLIFLSSSVGPTGSGSRSYGYAVRCLAR